jgi:hypothetical protein
MAPLAPAANAHLAEAESLIDGIIRFPLGISSNTTCSTALMAGADHTSELCELSYLYGDAEQIDALAIAICLRRGLSCE